MTENYACRIGVMLDELKQEYHYNEQDAVLVLKDILSHVWEEHKKQRER